MADGDAAHRRMLELGTSTLFEAGRPFNAVQVLDPGIRPLWEGARICGPAFPVACGERDNLAIHRAVELCPAGGVLVADGGASLVGYWGEILTVGALYQGIAGVVVDGGARDVDALRARAFPLFARGVGMPGAAKRDPGRLGEPVRVGGAVVAAGDVVVADADGVLVIAGAAASRVLRSGEERAAHEETLMARLAKGERTLDLFGLRAPHGASQPPDS